MRSWRGVDGVFRSIDGGKSWSGLNQTLPNLPATRLLSVPSGDQGVRLELADGSVVEWQPGQKIAWTPVPDLQTARNTALRASLTPAVGRPRNGGFHRRVPHLCRERRRRGHRFRRQRHHLAQRVRFSLRPGQRLLGGSERFPHRRGCIRASPDAARQHLPST